MDARVRRELFDERLGRMLGDAHRRMKEELRTMRDPTVGGQYAEVHYVWVRGDDDIYKYTVVLLLLPMETNAGQATVEVRPTVSWARVQAKSRLFDPGSTEPFPRRE